MRYLILSDIHGNLEALESILQYRDYDKLVLLGDLVGYGANPNEVIDRVRALNPIAVIRGNHDKVVAGVNEGYHFVSHALEAANWSRSQLTPSNFEYLKALPAGPLQIDELITLAHGSPADEEEYILGELDARYNFEAFQTPVCFFGHSHIAVVIGMDGCKSLSVILPTGSETYQLDLQKYPKYLINPGSVGQPRDGEWRGSAAVLDTQTRLLQYVRFEYDIRAAQEKIIQAGLPAFLAERLARGR